MVLNKADKRSEKDLLCVKKILLFIQFFDDEMEQIREDELIELA